MRSLLILLFVASVLAAACTPTPQPVVKPPVRFASTNFSEQITLAELYSRMLEAHGYDVERHFNLGNREIVEPSLESGKVDVYVEYLATMLRYVDRSAPSSADASETFDALQAALAPRGLRALAYAPAVDTNAFAVSRSTATRFEISKLSDLRPLAEQMVLGGPPECTVRPFCLPGLQDTYGLHFKAFKSLDALGPLTVAALQNGQIDVGLFGSTDAVVAQHDFVVLDDDWHLQRADNVAPVVRTDLLKEVPPDFVQLMNAVSEQLTSQDLVRLNAKVNLERQPVERVALAWLQSKGLISPTYSRSVD